MIAEDKALSELVGRLSECPRIALDTEADSLHCYFEKLCLIQVSAGDEHVLVDPLAGIDLQPLYDVVCSRRLVFHGADYDLRPTSGLLLPTNTTSIIRSWAGRALSH